MLQLHVPGNFSSAINFNSFYCNFKIQIDTYSSALEKKKIKKTTNMVILGVIGPWQVILILLLMVFYIIPWILALVDIATHEFEGQNKIVWVLIVALTGLIGALIYFIVGTRQKLPRKRDTF